MTAVERARAVVLSAAGTYRPHHDCDCWLDTQREKLIAMVAFAIGEAEAAVREECAQFVLLWCEDDARYVIQDSDARALAEAIRSRREPGEGKP